jgi:molybdopterin converting factor small subunit
MRVRVLLFGQLKDIVGRGEESLDLRSGARVSDVVARYAELFPKFGPMAGSIACSVNREYAAASLVLSEGDEVGLLPPVSGGKKVTGNPWSELKVKRWTTEARRHGAKQNLAQEAATERRARRGGNLPRK